VAVTSKTLHLLASYVGDQLPKGFSKRVA
jgi:hypothetical protein